MLIKVCGMRDSANICEVAALKPDLMGFIFYPKSKRYVDADFNPGLVRSVMPEVNTVGVFVNEDINKLLEIARIYGFDYLQLHGNESPEYCSVAQENGYKVLKAFGIHNKFDWTTLVPYQDVCNYFLFDTSTKDYGGSGQKFDWNILDQYKLRHPFFLSGGISSKDSGNVRDVTNPNMAGIDINSCFELSPGLKDVKKLSKFFVEMDHA